MSWMQATYTGKSDPFGFQHGQVYTIRTVRGMFYPIRVEAKQVPDASNEYLDAASVWKEWQLVREQEDQARKVFIATIAATTATTYVRTIGKKTAYTLEEVAAFLEEYRVTWKLNVPPLPAADIEPQFDLQHAQNEPEPGTRECRFTIRFSAPELHDGLPVEHTITIVEYPYGVIVGKGGQVHG